MRGGGFREKLARCLAPALIALAVLVPVTPAFGLDNPASDQPCTEQARIPIGPTAGNPARPESGIDWADHASRAEPGFNYLRTLTFAIQSSEASGERDAKVIMWREVGPAYPELTVYSDPTSIFFAAPFTIQGGGSTQVFSFVMGGGQYPLPDLPMERGPDVVDPGMFYEDYVGIISGESYDASDALQWGNMVQCIGGTDDRPALVQVDNQPTVNVAPSPLEVEVTNPGDFPDGAGGGGGGEICSVTTTTVPDADERLSACVQRVKLDEASNVGLWAALAVICFAVAAVFGMKLVRG